MSQGSLTRISFGLGLVCDSRAGRQYWLMGLFDSIHGGDYCGQVKCLGKGMRDLVVGDEVSLMVLIDEGREETLSMALKDFIARGGDQHAPESPLWEILNGAKSEVDTFSIKMTHGYVNVVKGVIVGWENSPLKGAVLVGNAGREIEDFEDTDFEAQRDLGWGSRTGWDEPSDPNACLVCKLVKDGLSHNEIKAEIERAREISRKALEELSARWISEELGR